MRVMQEMLNRGYHPGLEWFDVHYQGKDLPAREDDDTVDIEEMSKKLAETEVYIYPEHDDAYLEECLRILKERGYEINL